MKPDCLSSQLRGNQIKMEDTQSGNAGTIGYLRKKELCMELVDRLDVAEDGGEGVRVQSQGLVVPVNSAVEDLGGKSGLHLKGKMGN